MRPCRVPLSSGALETLIRANRIFTKGFPLAGLDKFSFSGLEDLSRLEAPQCEGVQASRGMMCSTTVDMTECGDEASKWQIVALAPSQGHALAVAVSRPLSGGAAVLTAVKTKPLQNGSDSILDCSMLEITPRP